MDEIFCLVRRCELDSFRQFTAAGEVFQEWIACRCFPAAGGDEGAIEEGGLAISEGLAIRSVDPAAGAEQHRMTGGKDWKRFMSGLPSVRIDDILVHPRDNDLIVGTHGRSIYIIDDITPLQQWSDAVTANDAHLFEVRKATAWANDIMKANGLGADKHFRAVNPQGGTAISYYLKAAATGDVKITITDSTGRVIREMDGAKEAGLNRVQWNLAPTTLLGGRGFGGRGGRGGGRGVPFVTPNAVDPGTYVVKLAVGGKELTTTVQIEADDFR